VRSAVHVHDVHVYGDDVASVFYKEELSLRYYAARQANRVDSNNFKFGGYMYIKVLKGSVNWREDINKQKKYTESGRGVVSQRGGVVFTLPNGEGRCKNLIAVQQ